jgi:hypothetical protein
MYLNSSVTYDYEPYLAVFFADFLFGEIKRKSGGVRGAAPATKAWSDVSRKIFSPPVHFAH